MLKFSTLTCLVCFSSVGSAGGNQLDSWLTQNEQRLKAHFEKIDFSKIGIKLSNLTLTDQILNLSSLTTNVYYIWVEKDGRPFELPYCKQPDNVQGYFPAWGGEVLSGGSYTYSYVQPNSYIVSTRCPLEF
ncbi:MAG: hypothetical protein GY928_29935 [Colwellia sp.]|nr:hypothetical protein [Colwellia sp.]